MSIKSLKDKLNEIALRLAKEKTYHHRAAEDLLQLSASLEILTVEQLKNKWDEGADQFNEWAELGTDEIVHFAQTWGAKP